MKEVATELGWKNKKKGGRSRKEKNRKEEGKVGKVGKGR